MRFVDEYRDESLAKALLAAIERDTRRPWTLMEICGGQTHTLLRSGIDRMIPEAITLVHGPGCPVCVTPLEMIDRAIAIASRPDTIFWSFGDMLRVPGSRDDLLKVKARGGDVRDAKREQKVSSNATNHEPAAKSNSSKIPPVTGSRGF